jgi:hypothetical protein
MSTNPSFSDSLRSTKMVRGPISSGPGYTGTGRHKIINDGNIKYTCKADAYQRKSYQGTLFLGADFEAGTRRKTIVRTTARKWRYASLNR